MISYDIYNLYIHISSILFEHLEHVVIVALQPWSFVGEQRPLFAVMAEGDQVPVFRCFAS